MEGDAGGRGLHLVEVEPGVFALVRRDPAAVERAGDVAAEARAAYGDEEPAELLVISLAVLRAAEQGAAGAISDEGEAASEIRRSAVRLLEGLRLLGPPPATTHPLAHLVGPVLPTARAVQLTGTSRQNLAALARNRRLIRLASSHRTQWWPTFQFRRAGPRIVAHPGVQALWQRLPAGTVSDWDHAAWLCTPRHDLDGDAPVDLAVDEAAVDREPLRAAVDAYVDRLLR
jgi:hypothetical protein